MKSRNITKFDSKGRLLIPSHIRRTLRIEEGTNVVIIPDNEKRYVKVIPLLKSRTAELRFQLEDAPGSLAKIARLLSQYNLDIILSESRNIVKGELAEWNVIVDTSECDELDELKKRALKLDNVKGMIIIKG